MLILAQRVSPAWRAACQFEFSLQYFGMQQFSMSVRVYLEDTDAGGIVYHASYLRFMERARTDWLRASGVALDEWQERHRRLFVVRSMTLDFLKPARLDEQLVASVKLVTMKRASLWCEQRIHRNEVPLIDARVRLACIDADTLAPAQIPVAISSAINEAVEA